MEQTAPYTPTPEYAPLLRGLDELAELLRAAAAVEARPRVPVIHEDAAPDHIPFCSLITPPVPLIT